MQYQIKVSEWLGRQLADARFYQIVYLSVFLIYGVQSLHWDFDVRNVAAIVFTALLTQLICCYLFNKPLDALKSAAITCLGLSILLKTQFWYIGALAGSMAILSKYLIRIKGKHIFNPANIGLVATIYMTKMAWVSPGQWGSNLIVLYFIFAAGSMLLLKVGRADTGLVFIFTYAFCQLIYSNLYLGWSLDYSIHKLSNGALLLYAFFMITDPSTTPNNKVARIIWSVSIALLAFYMAEFKYINGAPVKALFLVSLSTPIIDYLFKGINFSWKYSLKF
ncbi:MAG: RnfABCDGE type electron transport complex subunit D [Bacteroidota bacterium]